MDRRRYLAHRLAFLYVVGVVPAEVDHRNRVKSDNRWNNLRVADRSQNHANAKMHSRNTSGVKGVCWHKGGQCWWAFINWRGKRISLGHYKSLAAAKRERRATELIHFGRFAVS